MYDIKDFVEAPNEKILKYNNMKKWDVILANPPFNIGEKMLTKWFDLADTICTVQPSTWLLGKKKTKSICSHLDSGEFNADIESINGNEFFDAGISGVMAVQFFEKNITKHDDCLITFDNKQYTKTDDISLTSNDELLNEFKQIIIYNLTDTLRKHIKGVPGSHYESIYEYNPNNNWYCLKMMQVRGNKNLKTGKVKDDFYTLITNNKHTLESNKGLYSELIKNGMLYYYSFDTEQMLNNFVNYLQTYFVRALLYCYKTSIDITMVPIQNIPWFDFSDPVFSKSPSEIDDYLFAKYIPEVDEETGITRDEIRKHIEELLPDYYNIRK